MSFISKKIFIFLYKIHRYLGLWVAIHGIIFSLTGGVLLFKDELERALNFKDFQGSSSQRDADKGSIENSENQKKILNLQFYDLLIEELKIHYPKERLLAVFPHEENNEWTEVRLGLGGAIHLRGALKLLYDSKTVKEIKKSHSFLSQFFSITLSLHRDFFMGSLGKIYLGFVGILYVIVLFTGILIYGPWTKRQSFGEVRKSGVLEFRDWHKTLGVLTFSWTLVVAFSGIFLSFNGFLIKKFQGEILRDLKTHSSFAGQGINKVAPLSQIVRTALNSSSYSELEYLAFPDTEYGLPGHYLALIQGKNSLGFSEKKMMVMNQSSAEIVQVKDLPLTLRWLVLSEPFHFGNYGGWFLKFVWLFMSFCSLGVAVLGLFSFLRRKKEKIKSQIMEQKNNLKKEKRQDPFLCISKSWIRSLFLKPYRIIFIINSSLFFGLIALYLEIPLLKNLGMLGVSFPFIIFIFLVLGFLNRKRSSFEYKK